MSIYVGVIHVFFYEAVREEGRGWLQREGCSSRLRDTAQCLMTHYKSIHLQQMCHGNGPLLNILHHAKPQPFGWHQCEHTKHVSLLLLIN